MKVVLALAVMSAACTGGVNHALDASSNGSGSTSCQLTLSGALSGSYACSPAATYDASTNELDFGLSVSNAPETISVALGWTGMPAEKHYTPADSGAKGGVTVMMGGAVWLANAAKNGSPATGTYDLSFTALTAGATSNSRTIYTVHGSLSATLPAVTGTAATGTIMVSATF